MSVLKKYILRLSESIKRLMKKTGSALIRYAKKAMNTEDFSGAYSASDTASNKWFAVMCYIPLVCLYPIFLKRKSSAFVKFHASQGILVFFITVISTVLWAVYLHFYKISLLGVILYILVKLIFVLIELATTFLAFYGMFYSVLGRAKLLPVIGKFRLFR